MPFAYGSSIWIAVGWTLIILMVGVCDVNMGCLPLIMLVYELLGYVWVMGDGCHYIQLYALIILKGIKIFAMLPYIANIRKIWIH